MNLWDVFTFAAFAAGVGIIIGHIAWRVIDIHKHRRQKKHYSAFLQDYKRIKADGVFLCSDCMGKHKAVRATHSTLKNVMYLDTPVVEYRSSYVCEYHYKQALEAWLS